MSIVELIFIISEASGTIPQAIGLYKYRGLQLNMKLLILLFFIAFLVDTYSIYQAELDI